MNELKVFENPTFGQVRTVEIDNEPWFVGKDVAEALGYSDTAKAIRVHVDPEDKGVDEMATPGGKQNITIINESGLYSVIFTRPLRLLACAGTPESLSTPQPARRRYADRWG